MVITVMDYFKNNRNKYYLHVFLLSIVSFGIYYILRKTLFFTNHWNHQTSPEFLLNSLVKLNIPVYSLIRQSMMTMNIYFIYLLILIYKKHKGLEINRHFLFVSLAILFQITILSFAATFGNNNGRYFCLNIPLILYYIIFELSSFISIEIINKK
jgi:hypothetical protein